jgi:hypothetical protein
MEELQLGSWHADWRCTSSSLVGGFFPSAFVSAMGFGNLGRIGGFN